MAERIYGTPGTLYQRCGGVFGVSGFVDRLMDRWMADDTLNANEMVARWHESAQRPGFKFLVVQIVCCLTGGPQQYTGRDMAESHKHLGISEEEWGVTHPGRRFWWRSDGLKSHASVNMFSNYCFQG